jgi:phage shock protein C
LSLRFDRSLAKPLKKLPPMLLARLVLCISRSGATPASPRSKKMESTHGSILTRDDTFFGICEALGEDFGFNPFYLRLALGVGLIWNPIAMIAAYAAAGIVVAGTRLVAPDPRRAVEPVETDGAFVEAPVAGSSAAKQFGGAQPLPAAA